MKYFSLYIVLRMTNLLWLKAGVFHPCLMEQESGLEENGLTKCFSEMGNNIKPSFRWGFCHIFYFATIQMFGIWGIKGRRLL